MEVLTAVAPVERRFDRRVDDQRLIRVEQNIARLQEQMTENTLVTKQVAEVLASFRVVAAVAKWIAAVAAAVAAMRFGLDHWK